MRRRERKNGLYSVWNAVSEYLLERFEDPMLVFDGTGRVLAINAALERMLGWSRRDIIGRAWADLCPPGQERRLVTAWLTGGIQGIGRRIEVPAHTGSGMDVTLVMNITYLGSGEDSAVVGTVIASRSQAAVPLPCAEQGEYYEISSQPGSQGNLCYLGPTRRVDADVVGKPCYAGLYGREEPCTRCPAFADDARPGEVRTGVVHLGADQGLGLVTAEFSEQRVRVNVRRISRDEVNELVRARIDLLAEQGGLSSRERSVLALLIEGKSADDIGELLGISPRTAKFHQTNILQKLGVDSRLDLFRLLVG